MLYKTRGIVLNHIKYSETSIIVTIYTELFGRQSYIIQGVRGKKSRIKANIFQPLFLLDMEVYHKPKRDLQRVKEIQNAFIFSSLPYDLKKSTLAIFMAEILYKTIQEHEQNKNLFDYLFSSIQLLDLKEKSVSNFHIYFLLHLTKHLGFFPDNNYTVEKCFFDLKLGSFVQIKPMHFSYLEKSESKILSQFLDFSENQHEEIKIDYNQRINILDKMMEYYSLHHEGISGIKSLEILKEVFH